MTLKDEYISKISSLSDRFGNKLIEFLERYNLIGLKDATDCQLKDFYDNAVRNITETKDI